MKTTRFFTLARLILIVLVLLTACSQTPEPQVPRTNEPTLPSQAITGTVVAWGDNTYGQLDMPADLNDITAISTGCGSVHNLALKNNGTVVAWGYNDYGQASVPAGLNDVIAIAAQRWHSLALRSDGTVVAWGDNTYGQLDVPAALSDVIAIDAGNFHSLALKGDGTVVVWGDNSWGQLNVPADLNNVIAIAAGGLHNVALKDDGTVVGWGYDWWGLNTVPAGLHDVTAIAACYTNSLALKSDGTVVAWGWNNYGQNSIPASLNNVADIAAGSNHSLALKNDGTVVAWGTNTQGQLNTPEGLNNVIAIAAGAWHNLALIASDSTPPVITPTVTGTLGTNGWYISDVTVSWTVTDDESAISSSSGCDPVTIATDTDGTELTCTATSEGGTSSESVTIKRDSTAPVVAVTGVSNGATYTLSNVPTADCDTQDTLSGVAVAASLGISGGNTNGVGNFTATCSGALDNAGNTGSTSVSYKVIYNFAGFYSPVDNPPVLNVVKAGRAIPVKFSLSGDQGLDILATDSPSSVRISCGTGSAIDEIEVTVTAGSSSLTYDATSGRYIYVWKTSSTWKNTCRQFILTLNDNTVHIANFQFK